MFKNYSYFLLLLASTTIFILSCNSAYTYKKKGYFKISLPEKRYQLFEQAGYPYTFEYPVYAQVTKDSTFFDTKAGDWWINIDFPQFEGRMYISYKPVLKNNFDSLIADGYKMAFRKHTDMATGITDSLLITPNGIEGIFFSLTGNTATASQFFLTDSTRHFLRGALYFDTTPNEDSLSIVNEFLKQDIRHLINTLKWRN